MDTTAAPAYPRTGLRVNDASRSMYYRAARGVKAADRSLQFVASDESTDRYGDIIRASGWELESFRRNPVFLWAHQDKSPPIGRVASVEVKGTELLANVDFLPPGENDFADKLWLMVEGKALQAVSVGFIPTVPPNVRATANGDVLGYEFVGQELLELSLVTVPANPNALAVAKSLGFHDDALRALFNTSTAANASGSCPPVQGVPFSPQQVAQMRARHAASVSRRRAFLFT